MFLIIYKCNFYKIFAAHNFRTSRQIFKVNYWQNKYVIKNVEVVIYQLFHGMTL